MSFNTIEEAIADIRNGKMVILVDDEDRENEGDLTMAAEKVTPEAINFMAKYGRGLICLSLRPERVEELQLPMMTTDNTSSFGTAFTISIEAKKGVTTAYLQLTGRRPSKRQSTLRKGRGPRAARTRVSAPGAAGRCSSARRTDGRLRRPGAACGSLSRRCHL